MHDEMAQDEKMQEEKAYDEKEEGMRIVNLVENTQGVKGCPSEHGLSFYIETASHRLLMDTGQSDLFWKNAEALGIDLTQVDTVIVSHGHYDHGGGVPLFLERNKTAEVYIQKSAQGAFYSVPEGEEPHYIGLDPALFSSERIHWVEGDLRIDGELSLFTDISMDRPIPSANYILRKETPEGLVQDDFVHEQCLVIRQGTQRILLSGCAHHGILNVLDRFRDIYGKDPDAVLSGFHLRKKAGYKEEDIREFVALAYELKKYPNTMFYTGHCTGVEPYEVLKKHLGDRLIYVSCGDTVEIPAPKEETGKAALKEEQACQRTEKKTTGKGGRKEYMKWHKIFAWATVFCFVMTMITGYKKR